MIYVLNHRLASIHPFCSVYADRDKRHVCIQTSFPIFVISLVQSQSPAHISSASVTSHTEDVLLAMRSEAPPL